MNILKLFLIFIFLTFKFTNAETIFNQVANSKKWKALLHWDNKSKIEKHFYLSYPSISLELELKKTLDYFKSKNNKAAVCSFPARYLFLKQYFKLSEVNLTTCKDLQSFIEDFPKERIGLVYSSEYVNSPQSTFGHIMLVFYDNKNDLILSHVIHFAALAKRKNFFRYSYNGLTGKFNAFYIREPLFKRKYLYNDIEQRSMYIYWLNYPENSIKYLIYHLYELRKFRTKYYFVSENCATATFSLIKLIDDDVLNQKRKIFLPKLLPIHVIKIVKNKIYDKDVLYPSIVKVKILVDSMTPNEKKLFFDIITSKKEVKDYSLLPDIVKESLKYYFEFKFRTQHFVYPDYNKVVSLEYRKTNLKKIIPDPLNKTKFARLSISYTDKNKTGIEFSPYSISFFDLQNNPLQEKNYQILNGKITYKHKKAYVENIDLLKTDILPKQFIPYYKPFSWKLYFGFNRNNDEENLYFDIQVGTGKTFDVFGGFFNIMGVLGFDSKKLFNPYIQPELKYLFYLNQKVKIGYLGLYKIFLSNNYWKNTIFISVALSEKFRLLLKNNYSRNNDEKEISLSFFF